MFNLKFFQCLIIRNRKNDLFIKSLIILALLQSDLITCLVIFVIKLNNLTPFLVMKRQKKPTLLHPDKRKSTRNWYELYICIKYGIDHKQTKMWTLNETFLCLALSSLETLAFWFMVDWKVQTSELRGLMRKKCNEKEPTVRSLSPLLDRPIGWPAEKCKLEEERISPSSRFEPLTNYGYLLFSLSHFCSLIINIISTSLI